MAPKGDNIQNIFTVLKSLTKINYCILLINNAEYSLHFPEKVCFNSPKESRKLSVMKGAMYYVIAKYFRRKFAG